MNNNKMKQYIEMGEKKTGNQVKLAQYLGQYDSNIRRAKMGKIGLPDHACIMLADLIGVAKIEVIAASNLVTEKNEDRRKIFESCFSKAASIAFVAIMSVAAIPSPAEAAPTLDNAKGGAGTLYIMLNNV
jgi:hypothetical protein